jgi:hypothetical protein
VANPSKQRGTAFETAVTRWLNDNGHPHAERRALNGNTDRGDIAGIPDVVIECKNCKTITLSAWADELDVEMRNAGVAIGAVVIKRRGHGNPGDSYAVMPLHVLNRLLLDRHTR